MNSRENESKAVVNISGQEFETVGELKQNVGVTFNRVTIVENIYHETNDGPTQVPTPAFSYDLVSDEQAYMRILTVTDKLQRIDTGWLKDNVSMLHILNLEGKIPVARLTEEQQEVALQKVVGIYIDEPTGSVYVPPIPFAYISPRKSIRLFCNNFNNLPNLSQRYWIRSLSASNCKVQITCLPV